MPKDMPKDMKDSFTLAQLSDPHLSSLERVRKRDLLGKRALGYLSWLVNRRAEHRVEVLAALVRDLHCQQPDHIVITGDLTHLGLPHEFEEAKDWLCTLGSSSRVTVVPGNHDAYVAASWDRSFPQWAPYMISDSDGHQTVTTSGGGTTFPSLRVRGPIALIGVSTARPSAPFLAVGSLGASQLHKLGEVLEQAGREQLFRIVLMHHPPLPGIVRWRKRLTDSAHFRAVVARYGAELVLHGHAHRTSFVQLETSVESPLAIGVPSASAHGRKKGGRAQYHIYRLTRTSVGWQLLLSVHAYCSAEDRFKPQGETRLRVPRRVG